MCGVIGCETADDKRKSTSLVPAAISTSEISVSSRRLGKNVPASDNASV
jgi:hypothetical protein